MSNQQGEAKTVLAPLGPRGEVIPPASSEETARKPSKVAAAQLAHAALDHLRSERALPYFLAGPAVLIVLFVIGYPLVSNVWNSLHYGHLPSPRVNEWVGLEHYITAVTDPELRRAALNSITISGGTALFSVVTGFAWAIALNQARRFKAGLQVLVLTPWVLSGVMVARLWLWLLDPVLGVLNHWLVGFVLQPLFGFQGSLELTTSAQTAGLTVVIACGWRMTPFVFVMILAGLQSIPQELYEAAMVDGGNAYQRFRYITLPFLRYIVIIVALLVFVWVFNDFSILYVMTRGGPGYTTMVLPYRVYRFIVEGFRMGIGSALSMLMVLLLTLVAVAYVRLLRRQSEEGTLL